MAPNKYGVWQSNDKPPKYHPRPISPPKINGTWSPPQNFTPPAKTLTSLEGESSKAELLAAIDEWMAEAERLDREAEEETLEESLARLMFKIDVPLKIRDQEAVWDPSGNGEITKAEFRVHIREFGELKEFPVDQVDELFMKWDLDGGGTIDMDELEQALKTLRRDFIKKHGKNGWKLTTAQQAANMRARADMGRAALATNERVEVKEKDLQALVDSVETSLEVQLGLLLQKRRVNVGEVVGTWTKSRGTAGKRELSRSEFKDEVERMGLTAKGKPATRKQIGALFDTVDEDRSGWLDMEEAKQALKRWHSEAIKQLADVESKKKSIKKLKSSAAKKLQAALRPPDSPGSTLVTELETSSPRSPGGKSEANSPLPSPVGGGMAKAKSEPALW